MATKYQNPLNPFSGVAPGQVAICDFTIGPRYHVIWIAVTATPLDNTKTVTLADCAGLLVMKMNSKIFRSHDVSRLNEVQRLWDAGMGIQTINLSSPGNAPGAGHQIRYLIPVFLADPSRKNYAAQEAGALYTVWKDGYALDSMSLELTLPKTGNLAANGITVDGWTETTLDVGLLDSTGKRIMNVMQFSEIFQSYTASGKNTIANLAKEKILYALHFFTQPNDSITDFLMKVNGIVIRDTTKQRNDAVLIARGADPTKLSADRLDMIMDYSDVPTDVVDLNGANEFLVQPTLAAAGAVNKSITILRVEYGAW